MPGTCVALRPLGFTVIVLYEAVSDAKKRTADGNGTEPSVATGLTDRYEALRGSRGATLLLRLRRIRRGRRIRLRETRAIEQDAVRPRDWGAA
jgi:hypothetical protein